jgi:hypothetical protein
LGNRAARRPDAAAVCAWNRSLPNALPRRQGRFVPVTAAQILRNNENALDMRDHRSYVVLLPPTLRRRAFFDIVYRKIDH